jgi:hypothetical protein
MILRPATPGDISEILAFIRELAEYEREPDSAVATHADLLRDGFGPTPRFHCLIAECEGSAAGFVLYFYNYSTWRGGREFISRTCSFGRRFAGGGLARRCSRGLRRSRLRRDVRAWSGRC